MDPEEKASLFESVIDSLAHLVAGTDARRDVVWPKASVTAYDGFEVLDGRISDPDDFLLFADGPSDIPIWPMDARWAAWKDGKGWLFKRVATLNLRRWRGRLRLVVPWMCELSEMLITVDGRALGSAAPVAIVGDRVIDAMAHNHPLAGRRVNPGAIYGRTQKPDSGKFNNECMDLKLGHGIELRREYLWSVLMGEEGLPRARFVTDPIGVRAAFRLRDIPPGKARRAALRHWVTEHWRKNRQISRDDMNFVRQYLRGATAFSWNGLSCVIEPSRDDVQRNLPDPSRRAAAMAASARPGAGRPRR